MIIRVLLALTALLVGSAPAATHSFGKDREFTATIEPVFSIVPSAGYAPYRVTLETKLDAPRTFRIDATSEVSASWQNNDSLTSSFVLSCPPKSSVTRELLIPILPDIRAGDSGNTPSLRLRVSTAGSNPATEYLSGLDGSAPFRAMGEHLAADNLDKLDGAIKKISSSGSRSGRNGNQFAASFVPKTLPSDWRAYSGLDEILISSAGWNEVPAPARAAIASWIHTGGTLIYYATDDIIPDPTSLDLPATPILGKITYLKWEGIGSDLPIDTLIKEAETRQSGSGFAGKDLVNVFRNDDASTRVGVGTRTFNSSLVIIILLAFAILVGPVNLFKLAGPGRRHRLFITTPIIAVATSLILLVVIFIQDGLGGKGHRVAHLAIAGDARTSVIKQIQYSRTGVLLGSRFEVGENTVLLPAPVGDATKWNAYTRDSNRPGLSFSQSGDTQSGDWFRSRAEQAHVLTAVRPTRARLERKASREDGSPAITSGIEIHLKSIYICDENGKFWKSEGDVSPGSTPTFESSIKDPFVTFFEDAGADPPKDLRGTFVALADTSSPAAKAVFVETLGSVRWKDDILLITGSLPPAP